MYVFFDPHNLPAEGFLDSIERNEARQQRFADRRGLTRNIDEEPFFTDILGEDLPKIAPALALEVDPSSDGVPW